MKTRNLFEKIGILSLVALTFSCNNEEVSDLPTNSTPVILNQQFDISEDIEGLMTIGRLKATDADGEKLTFKLESEIDLTIDSVTGVVKTTENTIIDYETITTMRFNASVTDYHGARATATITINVLDVYEGPLSPLQQSFLDEYIHVSYNLAVGRSLSEKWKGEIRIFLDGNITSNYQQMVKASLEEFNSYFTDGTTIKLVNTLESSNVHLIMGPKSSVQSIWPDMFDIINNNGFIGYALYDRTINQHISEGRIWVDLPSRGLFMHEVGHIIGLGHASKPYCDSDNPSVMCPETASTASGFNPFDQEIIKALYHPGTPVSIRQNEMRTLITEYIIENSILE